MASTTQPELNFDKAKENADHGIASASSHAEREYVAWVTRAVGFIKSYPSDTFMVEQVRQYATANGLEEPPSLRAWGAVIREARKEKIVKHAGYGNTTNPKAHRTPASVWQKI
jgi:hypothetical protein